MLELFVIFYLITETLKLPLWYVENLLNYFKYKLNKIVKW